MARIPLKLDDVIDGAALRRKLDALVRKADLKPDEKRQKALALFKQTLADGRRTAEKMLMEDGGGTACAMRLSHLMDEIIRALYDFAVKQLHVVPPARTRRRPSAWRSSPSAAMAAARWRPAPTSTCCSCCPTSRRRWGEQVVEYMLYMLWDLGLKVGHATRNVDECIRLSRADMTIRTSILEARFLWGEQALFDDLMARFDKEVVKDTGAEFIAGQARRARRAPRQGRRHALSGRAERQGRQGRPARPADAVLDRQVFLPRAHAPRSWSSRASSRAPNIDQFRKAEDFLWAVRCHLHFLTGKAEERLHFDVQREIAERLGYTSHPGLSAVERFMKHYFLVAKDVGDLTRIFCAALEEEQAKHVPGFNRIFQTLLAAPAQARRHQRLHRRQRPHQHRRRRGLRARSGQPDPPVLARRQARAGLPSRRAEAA